MARTARNILRHELIGLQCTVMKSSNPSSLGIAGKITDETMKTIVVGKKRVQKKGSVFQVTLEEGNVRLDGSAIVARPEDRIKMKIRKW